MVTSVYLFVHAILFAILFACDFICVSFFFELDFPQKNLSFHKDQSERVKFGMSRPVGASAAHLRQTCQLPQFQGRVFYMDFLRQEG
jgi:hypothetical protein